MNILILTGKFGMGHVSAAEAIREEITVKYPNAQVTVVDFLEYLFPTCSKSIYDSFNFLVKHCSLLYNFLNNISRRYSGVPLRSIVLHKIQHLLAENKTDLVISTLPICSQSISAYKETTNSKLPLYTYITDIAVHEEWISKNTDRYFVGSQATKNSLVSKGLEADKIVVSGIPVRLNFMNKTESLSSRHSAKKEVLIMGGGLGLIPSGHGFLDTISRNRQLHITVITGKNQKLRQQLKDKYPTISIVGFTAEVDEYMKKADVIITKSGGITTFEAIHIGTPLYILKPFLSQEIGNADYIEQQNIGRVIWSNKVDIGEDILCLLDNPSLLQTMKENMNKLRQSWASSSPILYYELQGAINL